MDSQLVLEGVQGEINGIRTAAGLEESEATRTMSLIDDLELDSIMFVDLSLALERRFQIANFPMQAWADSEALRTEARYTVGSLVEYVTEILRDASYRPAAIE